MGKIKCNLAKEKSQPTTNKNGLSLSDGTTTINVILTLNEPVILGTQIGDQNTVASQDHVAGGKLLGMMAQDYISRHGVDDDFTEIFLSGALSFGFLTKDASFPAPLNIQYDKYDKKQIFDIYADDLQGKITKPLAMQITEQGEIIKVDKTSSFHTRRENRTAGSSLKEDGAAYYYESVDKGQVFHGKISGEADSIKKLVDKMGAQISGHLGLSKSSRYGHVSLQLSEDRADEKLEARDSYYAALLTPAILLDSHAQCSPTASAFAAALGLGESDVTEAYARTCPIYSYNTQWRSRTTKYTAMKDGSAFIINNYHGDKKTILIGEQTDKGYGMVRFYTPEEMKELKNEIKTSRAATNQSSPPISDLPDGAPVLLKNIKSNNDDQMKELKVKKQALADLNSLSLIHI